MYEHWILDSAYPLLRQVVTPFPQASEDETERQFNYLHSSTRIVIENAFGLLVSRWRFLWKHLYMLSIPRLAKTIYASCLLHNLCLSMNDEHLPHVHPNFQFSEELLNEINNNSRTPNDVEIISHTNTEETPQTTNTASTNDNNGNQRQRRRRRTTTRAPRTRSSLRQDGILRRNNIKQQLIRDNRIVL